MEPEDKIEYIDTRDYRWLCQDCGKNKQYLNQIAGTNVKYCEGCKRNDVTRYKYSR